MVRWLAALGVMLLFAAPLTLYAWIHQRAGHDGRVHIRYMAWGNPEQQATDYRMLQRFEELHPDLKVEFILVPGGDYQRKLQIMLASATEPDVYKMDLYSLPKYFPYGYFQPLDELAASDPTFSFDDFYPMTKQELTYQGHILGLNTLYGGKIIYYNKTLFAAAGLPDPYEQYTRGEWDLAAFLHAAQALTVREDGLTRQFGVKLDNTDVWWLAWTCGGEFIDKNHNVYIDTPETIAALTFYQDLQHKYRVMPRPGEDAGGVVTFEAGTLGMASGFAGESPRYRKRISGFEWDIVPVPAGPAGRQSLLKGNGLIISARSRHKAAAWELVKFLKSRETEMAYAGPALRRAIPTRISVAHSPAYLESNGQPPYNNQTFLALYDTGRALPVTAAWQTWQQEYGKWLDRLNRGNATPEEVARGMAADVRHALGEPLGPKLVSIGVPGAKAAREGPHEGAGE